MNYNIINNGNSVSIAFEDCLFSIAKFGVSIIFTNCSFKEANSSYNKEYEFLFIHWKYMYNKTKVIWIFSISINDSFC